MEFEVSPKSKLVRIVQHILCHSQHHFNSQTPTQAIIICTGYDLMGYIIWDLGCDPENKLSHKIPFWVTVKYILYKGSLFLFGGGLSSIWRLWVYFIQKNCSMRVSLEPGMEFLIRAKPTIFSFQSEEGKQESPDITSDSSAPLLSQDPVPFALPVLCLSNIFPAYPV